MYMADLAKESPKIIIITTNEMLDLSDYKEVEKGICEEILIFLNKNLR